MEIFRPDDRGCIGCAAMISRDQQQNRPAPAKGNHHRGSENLVDPTRISETESHFCPGVWRKSLLFDALQRNCGAASGKWSCPSSHQQSWSESSRRDARRLPAKFLRGRDIGLTAPNFAIASLIGRLAEAASTNGPGSSSCGRGRENASERTQPDTRALEGHTDLAANRKGSAGGDLKVVDRSGVVLLVEDVFQIQRHIPRATIVEHAGVPAREIG